MVSSRTQVHACALHTSRKWDTARAAGACCFTNHAQQCLSHVAGVAQQTSLDATQRSRVREPKCSICHIGTHLILDCCSRGHSGHSGSTRKGVMGSFSGSVGEWLTGSNGSRIGANVGIRGWSVVWRRSPTAEESKSCCRGLAEVSRLLKRRADSLARRINSPLTPVPFGNRNTESLCMHWPLSPLIARRALHLLSPSCLSARSAYLPAFPTALASFSSLPHSSHPSLLELCSSVSPPRVVLDFCTTTAASLLVYQQDLSIFQRG